MATVIRFFVASFTYVRGGALFLLLTIVAIGIASAVRGFHIEDTQLILFPAVCVALFLLPVRAAFRPPLVLGAIAMVMWMASSVHLRVLVPSSLADSDVLVLSRLKTDENSVFVRQFLKRYEVISSTHELPAAQLIKRSFRSGEAARRWLSGESTRRMLLVRGYKRWIAVVFNANLRFSAESSQVSRLSKQSSAEASRKKTTAEFVEEFQIPWIPGKLLLATYPESINSPSEPREFALHALAWLAQSIRHSNNLVGAESSLGLEEREAKREKSRDALAQVKDDGTTGLSNGTAAIGQYLLALHELVEYRQQGYLGAARIESAVALLREAAGFVKMEEDVELFSMIFNNVGVAMFAIAESEEDLYRAEYWLRIAHDSSLFGKRVPFGAQLAMQNLLTLEQARINFLE